VAAGSVPQTDALLSFFYPPTYAFLSAMKYLFKPLLLLAVSLALSAIGSAQSTEATAYEVWFTIGSTQHHGLLLAGAKGADWQFRVAYTDPKNRNPRLIEQKMTAAPNALGTCFRGRSVWDVHKKCCPADYASDNFYIYTDQAGRWHARNMDDSGSTVSLTIVPLKTAEQQNFKKRDFGWL